MTRTKYYYKDYTLIIEQLEQEGAKMMGQPLGTFAGCIYKEHKRVWVADGWDYLFDSSIDNVKNKLERRVDYIIKTPDYPKQILKKLRNAIL